MKKITLFSAVLLGINFIGYVQAADRGIESCISAIHKQKTGELIKLEKLNVAGTAFYEFELRDANGFEWEFMCNVNSGKITEIESEVKSGEARI